MGFEVGASDEVLVRLSRWAVDFRYPGDLIEATHQDAETAVEQARNVYETILNELKRRGYRTEGPEEDA
jgi:hypothetical protein